MWNSCLGAPLEHVGQLKHSEHPRHSRSFKRVVRLKRPGRWRRVQKLVGFETLGAAAASGTCGRSRIV
eukprot:399493-Lingulodinium_polyedra.AAC.1